MERRLVQLVRLRAENRCEYCQLSAELTKLSFPIDHIVAEMHGGATLAPNLALACPECNYHKGTNLTGIDPLTGEVTLLFHPRRDKWSEHFQWVGHRIVGRSAIGRTTIAVLNLNSEDRMRLRSVLPPPLTS